jgi:putative protease
LISQLTEKREAPRLSEVECSSQDAIKWMQNLGAAPSKAHSENTMKLNLLLREKGQVSDLIQAVKLGSIDKKALDTVTLDFEFGRDYQESVAALKEMGIKVGLATTRILKPNEYRNLKALADLKPDSILVRNLGALFYFNQERKGEFELKGDFSLNVTNHLTASYLSSKGLSSMCLSYDLNHHQVNQVLKDSHKYSFGSQFEVTIFQYMPSFHMEHCVFAAFLSEGSSYRDCGKPCEKHEVRLKDQFQNWHQIKADQECRNTMFNAKSQSASRYLQDWKDLGLRYVRYEALKERGEELISKLSAHIDLINGQTDFQNLMEKIGSIESYGLSEGQFGKEKEYLSRKKFQN